MAAAITQAEVVRVHRHETHLKKFRYRLNHIKSSEFLTLTNVGRRHGVRVRRTTEFQRIDTLMTAGNNSWLGEDYAKQEEFGQ